jgi:RHS repeat-associated protein
VLPFPRLDSSAECIYDSANACLPSAASDDASISTGKERDAESGNGYFGARYYASSMGRWLSPDWSAKIMPVPYAKLDNPQSLNLYAYVMNNPMTRFDLDGHFDCSGANAGGLGCLTQAAWKAMDNGTATSVGNYIGQIIQKNTALQEQAAEHQAQGNMAGYGQNNPQMAPGDKPGNMRLVASCQSGNHDCTYNLTGMGSYGGQANGYYVWEHQTSDVAGGQSVGTMDYITPNSNGSPERNSFHDTLTGGNLYPLLPAMDTYRFFTVSRSSTYRSEDQVPIAIQAGGKSYAYEHIFSTGGVVYINGSTHLQ